MRSEVNERERAKRREGSLLVGAESGVMDVGASLDGRHPEEGIPRAELSSVSPWVAEGVRTPPGAISLGDRGTPGRGFLGGFWGVPGGSFLAHFWAHFWAILGGSGSPPGAHKNWPVRRGLAVCDAQLRS